MENHATHHVINEIAGIFTAAANSALSPEAAAKKLTQMRQDGIDGAYFAYIDTIQQLAEDFLIESSPVNRQEVWSELRAEWQRLHKIADLTPQ